jgi:hypothetical protein
VYRPFAFSNVTLQKNIDVEYQICLGIGKGWSWPAGDSILYLFDWHASKAAKNL